MNLHKMLANGPNVVFDWFHQCEQDGYTPSNEDFIDRFGEQYPEWRELMPDVRMELFGEISDENFISMDEVMKDAGHKRSDFE